ncbi:22625_t:CDS:2 [Cetraspora pellucida]|uniref:22625_t:CDS:1 n=1 Tax=Cetraspora pellucida TaxID=1433469 RepID=A0A9N9EF72_9GLOM|nr:22625_t:CDS:2 [Cetraspora pellucida]
MIRVKRTDGVPKHEVIELRKKLRSLINTQNSKPIKGVMQFVALIDESFKCLEKQGFQYIQDEAARTAIVWKDGGLKNEEETTHTNINYINYWNNQDGEVIDEEDKEDVISLDASEFEFDDEKSSGIGYEKMDWI